MEMERVGRLGEGQIRQAFADFDLMSPVGIPRSASIDSRSQCLLSLL